MRHSAHALPSQTGLTAYLDQQLACTQDEACISVANTCGKLTKGSCIACVGVSAKQHLSRLAVTLLRVSQHEQQQH